MVFIVEVEARSADAFETVYDLINKATSCDKVDGVSDDPLCRIARPETDLKLKPRRVLQFIPIWSQSFFVRLDVWDYNLPECIFSSGLE